MTDYVEPIEVLKNIHSFIGSLSNVIKNDTTASLYDVYRVLVNMNDDLKAYIQAVAPAPETGVQMEECPPESVGETE